MPAGLRHVIRAAVAVLLIALGIPGAALAGSGGKCNASACKVYVEPNVPSAGKQQPQQTVAPARSGEGKKHVPKNLARSLSQAGRDRGPLKNLLADSGLGSLPDRGSAGSPSVLGAAFDLGAGPLALLSILLATAIGLAARGRVRGWLRRSPTD